jgi:hypothetical protein
MGPVIREESRCMSDVIWSSRTDGCGVERLGRTVQKADLSKVYSSSK